MSQIRHGQNNHIAHRIDNNTLFQHFTSNSKQSKVKLRRALMSRPSLEFL